MGNTLKSLECAVCSVKNQKLKQCYVCKAYCCQECWDFPVLDPKSDLQHFKDCSYKSGCIKCFKSSCTISFQQNYDIIGENNQKQLIFIHGAGSCRKMFEPHAITLAQRGYRSILIDLPGHGSRLKQTLDLHNSLKAIKQAIELCRTKEVTIIGGSLGGYILMEALGVEPDLCWKAVVMMSGQNVGIGRSIKASIGLWFIDKSAKWLSQASLANAFLMTASKNKNLNSQMIVKLLQGGIYFKHAEQNGNILKNGDYSHSLERVKNKIGILFINGEKDYRDSEQIWLEAAGNKSKLLTYEGADHFFSHDNRFYDRLIEDISDFIRN